MNTDWIKLQPIESAAKEYASNIVKGLSKFAEDDVDSEAFEEEMEVTSTDFENGAEWMMNLLVEWLDYTTDVNDLWHLVAKLRGEDIT